VHDSHAASAIDAVLRAIEERRRPPEPARDAGGAKLVDVYLAFAVSSLRLAGEQERACERLGLRARHELHVTVAFLGAVESERLTRIAEALRARLPQKLPTSLRTTGIGTATRGDEIVAWLAVEPDARLLEVRRVAREVLAGEGFAVAASYWPHITLGSRDSQPRLFDLYDIEKGPNDAPLALEVPVTAFHFTQVAIHPRSLVRLG
jgi:2'-5' RNA ligase